MIKRTLATIGFVILLNLLAMADDVVIPRAIDTKYFPPLTGALAKQEQENQAAKTLKSIDVIVKKNLDKKLKKEKRLSKYQEKRKKSKTISDGSAKKDADAFLFEKELAAYLESFYHDAELQQKIVSLHFKKAPLRKVITTINKLSGIQFVLDANIDGIIDELDVENVPLAFAIRLILCNNKKHLIALKDNEIWRIVDYSSAVEYVKPIVQDLIEKNYRHEWFTIQYAKWDDHFKKRIEKLWEGVIGDQKSNANTFLIFDEGSKKIFFKGRQQAVGTFKELLGEIDIPIPQVRLEARVVLADKSFEESFGLQWTGIYDQSASVKHMDFVSLGANKAIDSTTNLHTGVDYTSPLGPITRWSLNMIPTAYTATNAGTSIIPFVFGNRTMDSKRLNLILNAAESKSEIKTILKPTLLINSEEWAEVLVGEALPIETKINETVGANIANVTTTQYKDVGMRLKVRPVVSPSNEKVFLDIFVENSYVSNAKTTTTGATVTGLQGYTIAMSRSKNRVLLNSGQTTLISGLISNKQKDVKTGLPVLKDIPVLGWLFKGSQKVVEDKELLIFITPVVVHS